MGGMPEGARGSDVPADRANGVEVRRDALLIALTFAAGVVDAVSYLGLGQIFTANMTGNVVFLALALGERNLLTALHSATALISFSVGAIAAGLVLVRPRPAGLWPRRVTWLLWGQLAFFVVFAVGWVSVRGEPTGWLLYSLITLSAFAMGLQNAVARHLAVPGLTTTVVTGALTTFMMELPALGISGTAQRRSLFAVTALFAGAAVGASLTVFARPYAPFATVGVVAGVAFAAYFYFDRLPPTDATPEPPHRAAP
jgi:uncharacterized membrane protein YoaK (UPF0700 family)